MDQSSGKSSITIFDVAREAGVSYSTVSRVVNGHSSVKAATRNKVIKAMNKLGYVTNMQARSLAGGKSQIIGLLIYDLETSYTLDVVRGVDEQIAELNYDIILTTTHHRESKEVDFVARLTRGLVDGLLILLPRNVDAYNADLSRQNVPYVLIDHEVASPDVSTVTATNWQGAYEATKYLLELGHERIGFITGRSEMTTGRKRLSGYFAALAEHGIAYQDELVQEGDYTEESGHRGGGALLDHEHPPSAIFAANDMMALGVLRAAQERSLRIPQDLSVIGFDDIPEAQVAQPPLTTVEQPLHAMGRQAARLLVEQIEDPTRKSVKLELPTRLIVRASCQPPSKR